MTTVKELPLSNREFDFVIVGGGTAGCCIASRLAESLPEVSILVIEGGSTDWGRDDLHDLKGQVESWGGDADYQYTSVPQLNGNSFIQHSRGKILGGCSNINGCISFRPLEYDIRKWQELGAQGWTFSEFVRLFDKLPVKINPVIEKYQNPVDVKLIEASSNAFDLPKTESFNDDILRRGNLKPSTGFMSIAYDTENCYRNSSSISYIHPIFRGEVKRPGLTILTDAWVHKINFTGSTATGVALTLESSASINVKSRAETIVCAGAYDSPRLLLLSGLGNRAHLGELGIPVVADLPGVGENLMDHVETIMLWELKNPVPPEAVEYSDLAFFLRSEKPNAQGDDGDIMDSMFHVFTLGFDANLVRHGWKSPENAYTLLPNVPRPRSRGRVYLKSADPTVRPAIDFRYFTDIDSYDLRTILFELKACRKIGQTSPFKELIKREVAPGPEVQTDEELIAYIRKTHGTVFHPCGTVKMGDTRRDRLAVVNPELKVKGVRGLRVIDASVFPQITSVNPMITVYCVAEKGAEMIIKDYRAGGDLVSRM
ncbi:alcohol oxidase [Aspergillus californicus]